MCAGFGGDWEKGMSSRMGIGAYTPERRRGGAPLFFVSVASKGLSHIVSLLFATLVGGGSISVAVKGLKARVGSNQWTVVSEEKNKKSELERDELGGMRCDSFRTRSESSIEAQCE